MYRKYATELAVAACQKALREWGGPKESVTHVVAVTCTNAGSPGFDQEVVARLGLRLDVDRTLLHGVGCAGGLAALRTAKHMAKSSGRLPSNVLVFACEITSIQISAELEDAERSPHISIGPVLFSDGAAALMLCNGPAMSSSPAVPIYDLVDCTSERVPGTEGLMSYRPTQLGKKTQTLDLGVHETGQVNSADEENRPGFKLSLSRETPRWAVGAMQPAFSRILRTFPSVAAARSPLTMQKPLEAQGFDWALHPGGLSILKGAEAAMGLSKDHLRASYDIYRSRGNTSSVSVLAVLDRLRCMGPGREGVIACSFGPGLMVEMASLKRSR